ncbi:MAG: hypothetical protein COU11_00985 [Candidatus Harrisonbacteria bacterium CG10_big_fil_rev_8_21_14_0_10_49_15]|uniref:Uncharacterized protein n=1 Tax=Candidatus Harrisonbacteria bacterium CG10_big_fil_rev_8_21_14_0_10_49_15 TaxID=1974587 RepID=A0A2H0ULP4_9BACT|nr:MAG: hypothetical protein COU11_00985 [Candidatus Harrisonbacteria bacterium CG10_big_fil_rev_8_21_14_0_10_49_15]
MTNNELNEPVPGCKDGVRRKAIIGWVVHFYKQEWRIRRIRERVFKCRPCATYVASLHQTIAVAMDCRKRTASEEA